MMKKNENELPKKYYEIEDHGVEWHLFCKICKKGFALQKKHGVGEKLALLNHAYGHEEQ